MLKLLIRQNISRVKVTRLINTNTDAKTSIKKSYDYYRTRDILANDKKNVGDFLLLNRLKPEEMKLLQDELKQIELYYDKKHKERQNDTLDIKNEMMSLHLQHGLLTVLVTVVNVGFADMLMEFSKPHVITLINCLGMSLTLGLFPLIYISYRNDRKAIMEKKTQHDDLYLNKLSSMQKKWREYQQFNCNNCDTCDK